MCRWVAYAGAEIYLEDIIFDQDYSIVQQSLSARESIWSTNGDGFGVAWYSDKPTPGIFKDILPAWHDQTGLFLLQSLGTLPNLDRQSTLDISSGYQKTKPKQ